MITTILVHCPEDREWAQQVAGAWGAADIVLVEATPEADAFTFGNHLVVIGIWSGVAQAERASAIRTQLEGAPRRAVCFVAANVEPAPGLVGNFPALRGSGDLGTDVALLRRAQEDIRGGRSVTTEFAAQPRAQQQARPRRAQKPQPQPLPRAAPLPSDHIKRVPYKPPAPANNKRRVGMIVGAVAGVALFFGLAAPMLANWLASVEPRQREPAELEHVLRAAPPSAEAATPTLPITDDLRGFSGGASATAPANDAGAPQQSTTSPVDNSPQRNDPSVASLRDRAPGAGASPSNP